MAITITASSIKKKNDVCCENSRAIAPGISETIPVMIIKEVPFPIPLSVIFSPNHITNKVEQVRMITVVTVHKAVGFCTAPSRTTYW